LKTLQHTYKKSTVRQLRNTELWQGHNWATYVKTCI
jgi:hypothetical protein